MNHTGASTIRLLTCGPARAMCPVASDLVLVISV
uniref:Uncharacterized protein n=1 Tax=Arundo donax TaxID=35708 RepID=A0A0A9ATT0_ARUDO